MKHEIRAMLQTGGGSIINTASAASTVAMASMPGYVASKHGVLGLTKAAALDHAAEGIRVNAIAPGAVLTEMLLAGSAATPEGRARIEAVTPMKRIGSPEEVAEAVIWLASPRSSYVTGTLMPVDGGYVLP
jgi:NAD(P)-dependent dehydrogenase (short-subunit alcohol dehydrogenase family)